MKACSLVVVMCLYPDPLVVVRVGGPVVGVPSIISARVYGRDYTLFQLAGQRRGN